MDNGLGMFDSSYLSSSPLDALFVSESESSLPSYYGAGDSHNYGNGNFAFTDPSTWGDSLDNAGKFILASAYSGVNSFYNTGVAVGNFFGADLEENDTASALANIDSDLSAYYVANQQSIDTAGFIVSSLIPGIAGTKILSAGKLALREAAATGKLGDNVAGAVGLLKPTSQLTSQAAQDIIAGNTTFSALNSGTLKALASGVGSAALEGAAFEIAVAATMFKSPVLEDADAWDITKNILLGVGVSGAIGGAFNAAKVFGGIKNAVKEANIAEKPFSQITELYKAATPAERLITRFEDIALTPAALQENAENAIKFNRLRTDKLMKLNNLARTEVHEMTAAADSELGNIVADNLAGASSRDVASSFQYALQVGRASVELEAEKLSARIVKDNRKATAKSLPDKVKENPYAIQYVKLTGENAGTKSSILPPALGIADTIVPKTGVNASEQVFSKVRSYGFKPQNLWNPLESKGGVIEAQARYIWAKTVSLSGKDIAVHEFDIPLLQKAYEDMKLGSLPSIVVRDSKGLDYKLTSAEDVYTALKEAKQQVANSLLASAKKEISLTVGTNTDAIAKIVNVRNTWLDGIRGADESSDIFAAEYYSRKYHEDLVAKGLRKNTDPVQDINLLPSVMKVSYNIAPITGENGMVLQGMAYLAAKEKLYMEAVENVAANQMGSLYERFVQIPKELLLKANQYGAGGKFFSFSNGNYGSLASFTESIGLAAADMMKLKRFETSTRLESTAYQMVNNSEAAIEFQTLFEKVAGTAEHYVLNAAGDALIPRKIADYEARIAAGSKNLKVPELQEGAPLRIPILNQITRDAVEAHIELNGTRIRNYKEIRAVQGLEDAKDPRTFYPVRPNPKDYKFFAFVKDPSITAGAAGHTKMIHATSETELQRLIDRVPNNYDVITKKQTEEFFKAKDAYDLDRTLNENYLDAEMKKNGVNSQFFVKTDPQKITRDWVQDHLSREDVYVRELVNMKYQPVFDELRRLGDQYTNTATSKYGTTYRYAEDVVQNPYVSYVKTALNITQKNEAPLLTAFNENVDKAFSRAFQTIDDAWNGVKSPADLENVNKLLEKYGVKTAYYDAATQLLANHSAPKNALSSFIRSANSVLATLTLRLDPLNALNNAIGANVLLGAETKALVRAIKAGNTEAAGKLSALKDINLPGMQDVITAPGKLIANSMKRFFDPELGLQLKSLYRQNGWVTDISQQFDSILDDITLKGAETESELRKRMNSAVLKTKALAQKGEKFTGNAFAEEFNRFVAADVMKQITDIAVSSGIISAKESIPYINTFVNRTQGNFLASQRPLIFQGAIGQAVGLFQTYQFNLMQQLFRHVGEGAGKDAATLLGLQGTLYGLNGLPAFNYINTHIVGTASGNPNHTDLYASTYGIFGNQVGNWLLYGAPSNLIHTNLYSRGDINPRHPSVIPVNPLDIPIISATTNFFANLKEVSSKIIAGGSVWQSFVQGIEHNGLSRPLAGLAQVSQAAVTGGTVFSTSSKGTILGSNDLLSLSTIARLAGGRPLDEAIVNDASYRTSVYSAMDTEKKKFLAETVKSQVIAGGQVDGGEYATFAARYAELGGDSTRFNKYMMNQIMSANKPQAEKIIEELKSPYSQNMQRIMGGKDYGADVFQ